MSKLARVLVAAASLALCALYTVPLWRIGLTAPQYPEGIGMRIHINTVKGATEYDLGKINNLNKYIGMQAIEPESIPDLRVMPWLLAGLIATGVLVALAGRRTLATAWVVAFFALGAAGMIDFWRWEYDYGHNLDLENAIITIPGMSYQPPLIGTKQLLNFTATSWPDLGGWIAGFAFVLAVAALVVDRRQLRRVGRAAVVIAAAACAPGVPRTGSVDEHSHHAHAGGALLRPPPHPAAAAAETPRPGALTAIIRRARPGDTVVVRAGVYREPTIIVDKPLTIIGEGDAILDGEGQRQILTVAAHGVTVRGLQFRNVGVSHLEDRAAIRVVDANNCVIAENRIDDAFFGIYLAGATNCRIERNVLQANQRSEDASGNGIHLWSSREITIADNRVSGHRDGIYFEFVQGSTITNNVSEGNLRYGLHFMYSDDCGYERNTFRRNGSGVAVMYTKRVEMVGNSFEDNWGSAAYGLLLKEITDSRVIRNRFLRNTAGLVAEGANRLEASGNDFIDNGWALRLSASTDEGRIRANNFVGNTFDVATNSRQSSATLSGNYFDAYEGYDLDRDGFGDVPHRPVRLFSVVVEQNEPSLILLRSLFVRLLDAAERVIPALTPETLADARPAMRRLS